MRMIVALGPWQPDEHWLSIIVTATADAVAVIDADAVLRYANPAAEKLFGYPLAEREGKEVLDLIHEADLELAVGALAAMFDEPGRSGEPVEVRVRTAEGRYRQVELVATNQLVDERFGGLILSIRDITERRAAERGRASAERVLDHTFAHNPIAMTLCTLDGRFVKVNPAFCALVGLTEAELLADTYQARTDPAERAQEQEAMVAVIRGEKPSFTTDKRIVRSDGTARIGELTVSMVEDPDGVRLIFGQIRDVTEQRAMQRELEHLSLHDPLTGLANRRLFADRVGLAHRRHRRQQGGLSVAFIDIDDFKTVNDALGHAAGDQVLQAVADRLTQRFRATDTVARVGGDEFAVLLDEAGSVADAERIAGEILTLFDEPVEVAHRHLRIGVSVGIAPVPAGQPDGREVEEVVADADLAMYGAKQAGKGRWRAFRPAMRSQASARLAIQEQLQSGFGLDAVEVHYQPIVATATGETVGLEALARWRHLTLGLLRPGKFMDVVAEMGLVDDLDGRVLERVGQDRLAWRREAPSLLDLPIAVNIDVDDVGPRLDERIEVFLASPGGAGCRLFLELTERAMLVKSAEVEGSLTRLGTRGVGVSLDDFGVGYSSLAHLHRLPVGVVKLDRAFLASAQSAGPAFMAAVVDLCAALDLRVVAEGIETHEQHQLIRSVGLVWAQGYFYAKPMGPSALVDWLEGDQPAPPAQSASTSGAVGPLA